MNRLLLIGLVLPGLITFWAAPGSASGDPSLDPALRRLLDPGLPAAPGVLAAALHGTAPPPVPRGLLGALSVEDDLVLEVFLTLEPGAPAPSGEGVRGEWGVGDSRHAVRLTRAALRRLLATETVRSARLSRPVRPTLDRSTEFLGLRQVRTLNATSGAFRGATGRGVVIGMVDSGVDWSHPDFDDGSGNTRIYRYWDQGGRGGAPPAGFSGGTEYNDRSIDAGTAGGRDRTGHGTHVLGIAAGSGNGSFVPGEGAPFAGIAPEASLVVVRTNFTEIGVVLGAQYIFQQADELGFPAVLNLSLGNHFGPHVGDMPFELALAELVKPGKLMVAAAGNDGHRRIHAEMTLGPGETRTLPIEFPDFMASQDFFVFVDVEGWFDVRNRYRFTVLSPGGDEVGHFIFGDESEEFSDVRGVVRGWYTEDRDRGTLLLEIEENRASPRLPAGTWLLRVEALDVPGDPELDFWLVNWNTNGTLDHPEFLDHVDPEETVIIPATADGILAVGAVSTRSCWSNTSGVERCYTASPAAGEVAFFSSIGPTSDGRVKPEVLAPGFGIVSARSGAIAENVYTPEELAELTTPDGLYWINQGTSMSSPHAAGTAALLLQRYPRLTFEQMRGRFEGRGASIEDPRTGRAVRVLRTGEAVAPIVDLALSEIVPQGDGFLLRWFVGKARTPAEYRIYKGFSDAGPFHLLSTSRLRGDNPFEITDVHLEPGRPHVYRITAVDAWGLEDELDTLRTTVPGTPGFAFRAPDPNPARGPVTLRFFLPPTAAGGRFDIDVVSVTGRRTARLAGGEFGRDGQEGVAIWNLNDESGRRVPSGVYLVRLGYRVAPDPASGSDPTRFLVRRVVVLP